MKKEFNFFALFFFWIPVVGIVGMYLTSGWEHWFMMLLALVVMIMAHGARIDHVSNKNVKESEDIYAELDAIRFKRIELTQSIGRAQKNGDFNSRQKHVWEQIEELNQQEQELRSRTEVVNLEPLGHNVGRVYKKK